MVGIKFILFSLTLIILIFLVNIAPETNIWINPEICITDTICIRISSFTETYEDAQSKCASEGAHLVYDINQEIHVITFIV